MHFMQSGALLNDAIASSEGSKALQPLLAPTQLAAYTL